MFFCGLRTEKNKVRSQNISLDVTEAVMIVQKGPGGSLDQNKWREILGKRLFQQPCEALKAPPNC